MDVRHDDDGAEVDWKPIDVTSEASAEVINPDEGIDEDAIKIFGDLEKILGDDPSQKARREVNLHPTLVTRWKDWIVTGLSRDVLDELTDKYPRTGNVNLEPPALNPEVMHSLKETAQKRDKHFVYAQRLAGTALSALGAAITSLLREEAIDKLKLLELLSDAAKLLIEVHHKESSARIAYILPGMSKQIKAVLEETKPDTLLFGHGLTEKLQDAIALEKLGKELKLSQLPPAQSKKINPKTAANAKWKNQINKRPPYPGNHYHQHHNNAHDNRPRPVGPNRNFHQKNRQNPYDSGPPFRTQGQGRGQNQTRPQQNRLEDHRRP